MSEPQQFVRRTDTDTKCPNCGHETGYDMMSGTHFEYSESLRKNVVVGLFCGKCNHKWTPK